ncbi:hypothetical protein GEV29_11135 [Aeromicrobium sp. SMF47]|uniref:Uncharacterized protein n=1 Tax=Aeromicrobium yanjiei TaxID=2662028 RepID=A0A5Q2ML04_9ACTN|nr:hypothetical protein [Aeromicrobium yanjiei]MRJ77096.1 hypothetical protein [Aeromicrobium yanjiei]QGG41766.1 hypothetical protein GEV26_10555 [Aeromicrobium yanjiei]
MLMRSAARRTAAVLMVALVAMLLVATGGPARGAHQRVSAGTGHATAAGVQSGRHLDVQAPTPQHDQASHLLDLASTPPSPAPQRVDAGWTTLTTDTATYVGADAVTPTGRAPPAR